MQRKVKQGPIVRKTNEIMSSKWIRIPKEEATKIIIANNFYEEKKMGATKEAVMATQKLTVVLKAKDIQEME